MMSNRILAGFVVALAVPLAAMAGEDINYTFFDMKYVDNGIDESYSETMNGESLTIDLEGSGGFALLGSLAFHDNWHVFGEYAETDLDARLRVVADELDESVSIGADVDDWRLGIGFNMAFSPALDGVLQVAWEDRSVDFGSVTFEDETTSLDVDDDGFSVIAGLRGNVTEKFELNGQVHYSQVLGLDLTAEAEDDILDDDVLFAVGGVFHFTDKFSLGANVETGDSTAWYAFARVGFGS